MKKRLVILMVATLAVALTAGNVMAKKRWRIAGIAPVDHASTKILKAAANALNENGSFD